MLEILSLLYSWRFLLNRDVWGRSTLSAASCQEYGSVHQWNVSFPQTNILPCKLREEAKSETVSHTLGLSSESPFRGKCTQVDKQRNRFILTKVGSYRCSLIRKRYFLVLDIFIKLLADTWMQTSLLSCTCFLCEAFMQIHISPIYSWVFSVNYKLIFKIWVG